MWKNIKFISLAFRRLFICYFWTTGYLDMRFQRLSPKINGEKPEIHCTFADRPLEVMILLQWSPWRPELAGVGQISRARARFDGERSGKERGDHGELTTVIRGVGEGATMTGGGKWLAAAR